MAADLEKVQGDFLLSTENGILCVLIRIALLMRTHNIPLCKNIDNISLLCLLI